MGFERGQQSRRFNEELQKASQASLSRTQDGGVALTKANMRSIRNT